MQLPPIPGRYDFRALTFKASAGFSATPIEQDQFTMDIAIEPFPGNSLVYSSSTVSGDPYNLIRASFQVGLQVPLEGAVNFNFTVQDDIQKNSAGWPQDLGFGVL